MIDVFFYSLLNGPTPGIFSVYLWSFQTQILQKDAWGFSGIWTWIVRVEGKHADHSTTAQSLVLFLRFSTIKLFCMWTYPIMKLIYLCNDVENIH